MRTLGPVPNYPKGVRNREMCSLYPAKDTKGSNSGSRKVDTVIVSKPSCYGYQPNILTPAVTASEKGYQLPQYQDNGGVCGCAACGCCHGVRCHELVVCVCGHLPVVCVCVTTRPVKWTTKM